MDQSSKYSINTLCVQGGYTPGNRRTPPDSHCAEHHFQI